LRSQERLAAPLPDVCSSSNLTGLLYPREWRRLALLKANFSRSAWSDPAGFADQLVPSDSHRRAFRHPDRKPPDRDVAAINPSRSRMNYGVCSPGLCSGDLSSGPFGTRTHLYASCTRFIPASILSLFEARHPRTGIARYCAARVRTANFGVSSPKAYRLAILDNGSGLILPA